MVSNEINLEVFSSYETNHLNKPSKEIMSNKMNLEYIVSNERNLEQTLRPELTP